MLFIHNNREQYATYDTKQFQDLIIDSQDQKVTHYHCVELAKYLNLRDTLTELREWAVPRFPFSARVLVEAGLPKGPILSRIVEAVKQEWKASSFTLTESELNKIAQELVNDSRAEVGL